MTLIDSVYIHSFGGKSLLNYFVETIRKNDRIDEFFFFFDCRLKIDNKFSGLNFERVKPGHSSRKNAYKKHLKDVNKVFCFSNVPPPLQTGKIVYIYFHNILLLKNTSFKFILKRKYINFFSRNDYKWIVQTNYMKNELSSKLGITKNNISLYPFFKTNDIEYKKKNFSSKFLIFLYITSNLKHKNIKKLISAFKSAKTKNKIRLLITSDGQDIKTHNKEIIFIGIKNRSELIEIYSKAHYLIFPSLNESLGIPIIESIKSGLKIIISDIPTFNEICQANYLFNPKSQNEIKNSIEMASIDKNKKMPELYINDSIEDLINIF